jgi:hypothetical protein
LTFPTNLPDTQHKLTYQVKINNIDGMLLVDEYSYQGLPEFSAKKLAVI